MKVKIIDISWIGDKSLDLYCSNVIPMHSSPRDIRYNSKSVNAAATKIFNNVFDSTVEYFGKKYDKTFIVVPCYPITRMEKVSIITRFICNNSDFLSENGVSSNQFQEMFEKFILSKSKCEYITNISENVFMLNARGILLTDWVNAITEHYGSSLVDFSKEHPFDSNPNFIINLEGKTELFTKTTEEIKFRLSEIISSI